MKRTILAAILATTGVALANPPAPRADASATARATSSAAASNRNVNAAYGGTGLGGAGGIGGAGGAGGASSATQTLTLGGVPAYQTITSNGRVQVENVPNIYAPNIYPTAPCMGSSSVGAGWVGFGMSGGTSWVDTECQLQEAARNAPTSVDRVYVWCKTAAAKGAPSCAGLRPDPSTVTGSVPAERDRHTASVVDQNVWRGGE
jgi:hypothetical protein